MIDIPLTADCTEADREMKQLLELVEMSPMVRDQIAMLAANGVEPYEVINTPGGLRVRLSEPYWAALEDAAWLS